MALFSERSEWYIASKNGTEVRNLTSKVVPKPKFPRTGTTFEVRFLASVLFFDVMHYSDRSENSAIRSALKNCIDIVPV